MEPTRDEVFAYVDAHRSSPTAAADAVRYFAARGQIIAGSKIRTWMARRSESLRTAVADEKEAMKTGSAGEGGSATKPGAEGRARPATPPRVPAALLTPSAREKLRRAVEQQLDFLSDPDTIEDQKGRADAARALQTLLAGTPDILTFEERTNGLDNDGAAGREDAARRVSRALDPDSTDGPEDGG